MGVNLHAPADLPLLAHHFHPRRDSVCAAYLYSLLLLSLSSISDL